MRLADSADPWHAIAKGRVEYEFGEGRERKRSRAPGSVASDDSGSFADGERLPAGHDGHV